MMVRTATSFLLLATLLPARAGKRQTNRGVVQRNHIGTSEMQLRGRKKRELGDSYYNDDDGDDDNGDDNNDDTGDDANGDDANGDDTYTNYDYQRDDDDAFYAAYDDDDGSGNYYESNKNYSASSYVNDDGYKGGASVQSDYNDNGNNRNPYDYSFEQDDDLDESSAKRDVNMGQLSPGETLFLSVGIGVVMLLLLVSFLFGTYILDSIKACIRPKKDDDERVDDFSKLPSF
jgi:hypothetical protein